MKKVLINLFLVLLVTIPAHAQNGTAEPASSGTLMASVMEQVGYHAQSQVLTQLGDGIEEVAGLIYLGVLVSIIMTVGLQGNYRAALWILVGPPIFLYTSGIEMSGQKNTIKGASVEWRFGAFEDKKVDNDQEKMIQESESADSRSKAEVSFVFHKYNVLISELYQYLISVMTNHDTRTQMMFMTRTRMQEELFEQRPDLPGFIALGQYFLANCGTEIAYAAYVAQGLRDPQKRKDPYWETAKTEYCRLFDQVKAFPPGPWQDYLYSENIYKGLHVKKADNESVKRMQEEGLASCNLLWQGLMHGAEEAVKAHIEQGASIAIMKQAWKQSGTKTFDEVMNGLKDKLTLDKKMDATIQEKKNTEKVECISGDSSIDVNSDVQVVTRLIAGYTVRKIIVTSPYAETLTRVNDRDHGILADQTFPVGTEPGVKQASLRRAGASQYSDTRREEALFLITIFPYLQGMILYVLAVIYPFFCLMLLLPGQAGSFFLWMALWAWAKSWDVGWAMVMIADEVLWEMMPKTAFLNPESVIDGTNPVSLLEMTFDGDPSYTSATYWLLLSGMISAVPVITANMILGAKKAVSGVLISNFAAIADPFAAGAADWAAGSQGRVFTSRREAAGALDLMNKSIAGQTRMARDSQVVNDQIKGKADELSEQTLKKGGSNTGVQQAQQELNAANAEASAIESQLRGGN